jgi:ribonuclease D
MPPDVRTRDYTLVDSRDGLAELAAAMMAAPEHAIDSESNSGFAYSEQMCLLQANVEGRLWLVDLVALPREPEVLDPLRPALESLSQPTFLHGGEYDVGLLRRDYGIQPAAVWDSQQATSLLGWPQTGYGTLVERICGVKLAKGHAFHDWARRPLAPDPLRYALDDVRYLPAVCRRLRELVAEADLEEEVEIAGRAVAAATWNGGFRPEGLWRIKGVRQLERGRLPLLSALFAWREEVAREVDMPPGRLINNALLLALARAAPSRPDELRRLGLGGRSLERWGRAVLGVLEQARRDPPPVPRAPLVPRPQPAERERNRRLRDWRRQESARRGVTEQAVLPAAALRHLAEHGPGQLAAVPQLGEKRIRLYGNTLKRLAS